MSSYEQERGITISAVGDDVSIGYHASVSDGVIYATDPEQTPQKDDGSPKSLCVVDYIRPQTEDFVIVIQKAVHEEYHMPTHRGGKGDRVRRRQQFRNGRR